MAKRRVTEVSEKVLYKSKRPPEPAIRNPGFPRKPEAEIPEDHQGTKRSEKGEKGVDDYQGI